MLIKTMISTIIPTLVTYAFCSENKIIAIRERHPISKKWCQKELDLRSRLPPYIEI